MKNLFGLTGNLGVNYKRYTRIEGPESIRETEIKGSHYKSTSTKYATRMLGLIANIKSDKIKGVGKADALDGCDSLHCENGMKIYYNKEMVNTLIVEQGHKPTIFNGIETESRWFISIDRLSLEKLPDELRILAKKARSNVRKLIKKG